jgi:hypothetical protein
MGLALVRTSVAAQGVPDRNSVVPCLNFEKGRLFARIEPFGVKTLPLGMGHLELLGQERSDGCKGGGWSQRKDPVPLGLGTLQITPIGAFGLNVLHDFGASGGTLVQARYLAKLPPGRLTLYPELGLERQSSGYTRYDLGTTAADAATAGCAYQPGAACSWTAIWSTARWPGMGTGTRACWRWPTSIDAAAKPPGQAPSTQARLPWHRYFQCMYSPRPCTEPSRP